MYLVCSGRGSPTVVFEADAGRTSSDWQKVRDEVIEFTRACAYDRAGLGRSTPGKPEQDPIIITTQLEVLLQTAEVSGQLLLVGHSLGGYYTRIFANRYPERVAGLVEVDPAFEEFLERAKPYMPAEQWARKVQSEEPMARLLRGVKPRPVPFIVLTSGQTGVPAGKGDAAAQLKEEWKLAHADLMRLYPGGKQIVALNTGHFVQRDDPDLVVRAIREVVDQVRRPLRPLGPERDHRSPGRYAASRLALISSNVNHAGSNLPRP